MKRGLGYVLAAIGICAISIACSANKSDGMDPSKVPDDLKSDYQIFAQRCSKCHSLARPLTSNITDDQQWIDYVNRMRRQPTSGITLNDQAHILRFLKWYAAELRRQEEEKRAGDRTTGPTPIPPPVPSYIPEPPPLPDGGMP
jgi:hypothetical protein